MEIKFKDISVPEQLDQVVEQSMKKIYEQKRHRRMKNRAIGLGTVAAIFILGIFFCVTNPTIAAKIPWIGHIFEQLQNEYYYSGDYSKVKQQLPQKEMPADDGATERIEDTVAEHESAFTSTVGDITITLSEIYCNNQALYISVQMKSEKEFPKLADNFCVQTIEQYSFNPTKQKDQPDIFGKCVDAHTYVGIMRFDLNEKTYVGIDEEYALKKGQEMGLAEGMLYIDEDTPKIETEVTDSFTLQLKIKSLKINFKEVVNESDAIKYKGPWKFTLQVKKNMDDAQELKINDINKQGIGLGKITKDRFEITVFDIYKKKKEAADYFPVILDADGMRMPNVGGGSVNTVAIQDRDVSKIDIYLIDYKKWMDDLELRGDIWYQNPDMRTKDGKTMKEKLEEEAAYHKEIKFQ